MSFFSPFGFDWDRTAVPTLPVQPLDHVRLRYQQALPQFVFDASALEGNPFTFPEVKTLMDGTTVGGHKLSDAQQVTNLAKASRRLLALVQGKAFKLDKETSDALHGLIAYQEALEWGHFRGEGAEEGFTPAVSLGEQPAYHPLPTQSGGKNLLKLYQDGIQAMAQTVLNPLERALSYFLFGALHQFYFDGNKRTARAMMNGILLSAGLDAISIPAKSAHIFNKKMVQFYTHKNGTEMMAFLITCLPR